MELKITDADFKAALAETIMASIGVDGQKAIITDAISHLCEKRQYNQNDYNNRGKEKPSFVEEYFGDAVGRIARNTINEMVENDPEVKEAVTKMIRGAVVTMANDGAIGDALAAAMTNFWREKSY
jgi:hypothetical protein